MIFMVYYKLKKFRKYIVGRFWFENWKKENSLFFNFLDNFMNFIYYKMSNVKMWLVICLMVVRGE